MFSNNTLTSMKEKAIKIAKLITKEQACLLLQIAKKFNDIWIQLMPNKDITLSQKTRVRSISLIKDHETSINSSKEVVYTNLSPKSKI